jgi:hypothetical protein
LFTNFRPVVCPVIANEKEGASMSVTSTIPQTSPPAASSVTPNTRPGLPLAVTADSLGPLADLAGSWIGRGFNLISLPDFDSNPPSTGPKPFRVKLNSTVEILEFTPIGGAVPNRGSTGQNDISIFGLRYLQRVADLVTNEAMHIEPGFWLSVPATTVPAGDATVVRQGTIPHGNSMLAIGRAISVGGGPLINPVDSTPVKNPDVPPALGEAYLEPLESPPLPPDFKPGFVKNLNLALQEAILGQNIRHTEVLIISTASPAAGPATQVGGIVNMPFDLPNANPTKLDAIFWIETVEQPDGSVMMQLQYTQTVVLNFLGIDWPHISVATLVKQ